MERAVVLAAGRGTRMRRPDPGVPLTEAQAAAADAGLKTLIPFHGRPFLAYVLDELADAGYREVCVVTGPGQDDPVRAAVRALSASTLRLELAVQAEPLGSADAVAAAGPVVGDAPFAVINADNLYPAPVLARLRDLEGNGLVGFERAALVRESNIPADRLAAFALLDVDDGWLRRIAEKPDPARVRARPDDPVSMTCWRFDRAVLDACREVEPSARDERELPDAVELAMSRGSRFRVIPARAGVLDLSRRSDIPEVERRLRGREARR